MRNVVSSQPLHCCNEFNWWFHIVGPHNRSFKVPISFLSLWNGEFVKIGFSSNDASWLLDSLRHRSLLKPRHLQSSSFCFSWHNAHSCCLPDRSYSVEKPRSCYGNRLASWWCIWPRLPRQPRRSWLTTKPRSLWVAFDVFSVLDLPQGQSYLCQTVLWSFPWCDCASSYVRHFRWWDFLAGNWPWPSWTVRLRSPVHPRHAVGSRRLDCNTWMTSG